MSDFKQLAIIGPTASGKTSLAIRTAQRLDAYILSLDSLSVYKEIDIVSAKPTKEERGNIVHFGIDHLSPDKDFDVTLFTRLYKQVRQQCIKEQKNLVIVGGTSFYLKILLEGISLRPVLSAQHREHVSLWMRDLTSAYTMLNKMAPLHMQTIKPSDRYRIEKALEIYAVTGESPEHYFATHPPKPVITEPLPLYEIVWERVQLRERIRQRTETMLKSGLIDEIIMLERRYTRAPNCMRAIGIKETLMYLDGIYDKKTLTEKITVNTGRLAKRQETFNRSQFNDVIRGNIEELKKKLLW